MPEIHTFLPRYSACTYSLFVSYAHADDEGNNEWVTALKKAIFKRLKLLRRDVAKLDLHLSSKDGPTVGRLSDELQERVRSSFGMLLVVGEQYVTSGWCEKELELFEQVFGLEGTKKRLLIVALSADALTRAQEGKVWRRVVAADQVWLPMYDDGQPIEPMENGRFSPAFFSKVVKLIDPFRDEIVRSVDQECIEPVPAKGPARTPWQASSAEPLSVAIGPFTDNLGAKAQALASALEGAGAKVKVLDRKFVDNYKRKGNSPLREELRAADVLVVPIVDVDPLQEVLPGGHAATLQSEWARLQKNRSIVWYRPDDIAVPDGERADAEHLEIFRQLAPVCTSEAAVVNLLFGTGASKALRIYIERHAKEPSVYRLGRMIEEAWARLPPDPARPSLSFILLDLDEVDSAPYKDPAGVVLIGPHGLKPMNSLRAQIDLIREVFPCNGAYPGFVAMILPPPPPKKCPMHDWAGIKFYKYADEPMLRIDEESQPWLDEFVRELWHRHRPVAQLQ